MILSVRPSCVAVIRKVKSHLMALQPPDLCSPLTMRHRPHIPACAMLSSQLPLLLVQARDFRGAFVMSRVAHQTSGQHGWHSLLVLYCPGKDSPATRSTQLRVQVEGPAVSAHEPQYGAQASSSESETSSPRSRRASLSFLAFFFSLLFSVFFCCFTFTTLPAHAQQHTSTTALQHQHFREHLMTQPCHGRTRN